MSQAAREALVANPKLSFTDDSQKPDLLDESITNTYLIAMLQWMMDNCPEDIMLTAVRTDHPTVDGAWEHSGGNAVDCYPLHWEGREQEACCAVMKGLADNPYCEQVGLGGVTQQWKSYVTWPSAPSGDDFVFDDVPVDHLHASCANPTNVTGGARAAGGAW